MSDPLTCTKVWGGGGSIDTEFIVPGMSGAIYSRPASGTAGGDIYLISSCETGLVSKIVLADVAGHGEQVARIGKTLSDLLWSNVGERDNDRFLDQLNQQFEASESRSVIFATLACTTYYPRTGQFCFAYAGHPQMILGRAGQFAPLDMPRPPSNLMSNLPIGVHRDVQFRQGCLRLEPDDWVILFSDGLIEARNPLSQEYGLARMQRDLKTLSLTSPMVVKNGLLTRLHDFVAPLEPDQDDLTLIVLKLGVQPPKPITKMAPELEKLMGK